MTREKAKEIISYHRHLVDKDKSGLLDKELEYQAIEMAIKALEQEPCEDAISRQAVLDYIDKMPSELTADGRRMIRRRALEEYISDTLPSVKPQEPKTGHWIEKDGFDGDTYYDCSECGESWTTIEGTPWQNGMDYCPNCGAKMVEPQERRDEE